MFSGLFGKKKKKNLPNNGRTENAYEQTNSNHTEQPPEPKQKLVFHTQLAHGSPTGRIEGFANVRELYARIATSLSVPKEEILFCTLNSHKCDMTKLLGGQIGLEDFIFAHVKGQKKSVQLTKSEASLGLTITDNGAGYAFIKRIKEETIADSCRTLCVGDHIEAIDDKSLIGCRHFEVAKALKDIPLGATLTMTLVEPRKAFDMIAQRKAPQSTANSNNVGTGKATLRLRSKGPATVQAIPTESEDKAVGKIDDCLESFMGIRDTELASTIYEAGKTCSNPDQFVASLESQLGEFGFPENFIFDVWGVLSDAKRGTF
ncbi:PDZ domain-containing protein GIPC2-like [Styela clava]|uniref:PDZ domain-containing protein GIPC2-like n=1 Tax=Styela clava TaxID=7725 RepID=UPI0019398143|nr:PDZ domain-containing protein GIPC2-like [Styela clava]